MKSIRPAKFERWGVRVVRPICLDRGADCLHMVQSSHPKAQSSLASFKYRLVLPVCMVSAYRGCPGKEAVKGCSSSSSHSPPTERTLRLTPGPYNWSGPRIHWLYLLTVLSPFSTPVPPNLCSTLHGGMHADARLICICTQAADADRRHHGAQVSEMLDSAAGLRPSQHQEGASRPRPRELLHSTPRPLLTSARANRCTCRRAVTEHQTWNRVTFCDPVFQRPGVGWLVGVEFNAPLDAV